MGIENNGEVGVYATPGELNAFMGEVHTHMAMVGPMGGNDSEHPTALRILSQLQSGNRILKEQIVKWRAELGSPDSKSSDYR